MKKKVIYYRDELHEEFSEAKISPKSIDETYRYEGGRLRPLGRGLWYHLLAKPIAWMIMKIGFGHRIVNGSILKSARKEGYFLYGNHTNPVPDAFIPTMLNFTGSVYVIVHPANVSMPVLSRVTPSLGALPLPDTKGAFKNFLKTLEHHCDRHKVIMIYPEAHIWPYYTKIRPFVADSFQFPILFHKPVYCLTNTYQKRLFFKRPRMVTYVDGPFYPDESLPRGRQKQELRDRVYETMTKRSTNNTVEYIHYEKINA